MNTRLILIDGMPGSGKSTTGKWISEILNASSIPNRFYHELDDNHPLRIYERRFSSFTVIEEAEWFTAKVKQLFTDFVEAIKQNDEIIIMESYMFQNTIGFAYNMQMNPQEILKLTESLQSILSDLNPILIYYYQVNVEQNWRWICEIRGPEFAQDRCGLYTDDDFVKAGEFWTSNQNFIFDIVQKWEIPTLIIKNQAHQWEQYNGKIKQFLIDQIADSKHPIT